jgi:3D (Asp-Asp-Asp) domain-containing protein
LKRTLAKAALGIIVVAVAMSAAGSAGLYLDKLLSQDQQTQMGLYKLTEQERLNLSNYIQSSTPRVDTSILTLSAKAYVRKYGWKQVSVIDMDYINNRWWIIVEVRPYTYAIETPLMRSNFLPGEYWAKTSPVSGISSMLDEYGNEVSFLLSKYKKLR